MLVTLQQHRNANDFVNAIARRLAGRTDVRQFDPASLLMILELVMEVLAMFENCPAQRGAESTLQLAAEAARERNWTWRLLVYRGRRVGRKYGDGSRSSAKKTVRAMLAELVQLDEHEIENVRDNLHLIEAA